MRISDWSSDVCSSDLPVRGAWRREDDRDRPASSSDRCRRDRQRRVRVGMIEQLEDDRGGEGRGDSFRAQHVEQGVFVGVEVHAFDREIGAGFGIAFAPHRDFGGGAAPIIERADLGADRPDVEGARPGRSEAHTSELQSLMRLSYAVFCLKKKKTQTQQYYKN